MCAQPRVRRIRGCGGPELTCLFFHGVIDRVPKSEWLWISMLQSTLAHGAASTMFLYRLSIADRIRKESKESLPLKHFFLVVCGGSACPGGSPRECATRPGRGDAWLGRHLRHCFTSPQYVADSELSSDATIVALLWHSWLPQVFFAL